MARLSPYAIAGLAERGPPIPQRGLSAVSRFLGGALSETGDRNGDDGSP
jgi:hypothetical protein